MAVEPVLDTPLLTTGQADKESTINEAIKDHAATLAGTYELDCSAGGTLTLPFDTTNDLSDRSGLHFMVLKLTGAPAAAFNVVHPDRSHFFIVKNTTGQDATIKLAASTGTVVAAGVASALYSDATDVTEITQVGNAAEENWMIAVSDENTALTTGTSKITFRAPTAVNLTVVRASLIVAQATGAILTIDINVNGASILSTKLTVDNTEKTSLTATAPPVISSAAIAEDDEITIDIDQVGDGTAVGLKLLLRGTRT